MALPTKFTKPWSAVDPSMQHGGIPGGLSEGWVGADLTDNLSTTNKDIHSTVYWLSQALTAVSMNPEADAQGMPGKRLVEQCLSVARTFTEMVVDCTHTHASKFFAFTHAIPPSNMFKITPIRYPVRSIFAEEFLHYGIGTLIELAENNRNAVHKGLDSQASNVILEATYTWKAGVMKYWFDKEVAGEISTAELENLYMGLTRSVPSYPDVTAETPETGDVAEALSGLDVLAFVPTNADWTKVRRIAQPSFRARSYFPARSCATRNGRHAARRRCEPFLHRRPDAVRPEPLRFSDWGEPRVR
jgi:hypothetical protein